MFDDNIRVESVPMRVYEFCRIASSGPVSMDEMASKMIPESLFDSTNYGTAKGYLKPVYGAAEELKLVQKDEAKKVHYIGQKDTVSTLDSFRRYCNSVVWKNKNTRFYRLAKMFLESNLEWLKYSSFSSSPEIFAEIRSKTNDDDSSLVTHLLGERFWLSFLGFGYVLEKPGMTFLPNMYIALKDFIVLSGVEKNREMPIREFLEKIKSVSDVYLEKVDETHQFNYAFSSALRELHDNREIVLKRNPDSKENWNLYYQSSHEFPKEISHVIIKGVK